MKSSIIKFKEDYRFTLLLAVFGHILLFSTLFLALRHSKPLFLTTALPPPIIQATAVTSSQLPTQTPAEKEKITPPPKAQKTAIKPLFVEKSPISLAVKGKKVIKTAVNTSSVLARSPLKKTMTVKKRQTAVSAKPKSVIAKEKNTQHPVSTKSLQLAQKNVQQLLQQEVTTLEKRQQIAARHAASTEKYRHLILQAIAQQWIIPPKLSKNLETKLRVQLAPGGMVIDVVIVKASGNPVLDRSAQSAVYKASPLPVPKDGLFNHFRQINLTVRPEGFIT
jgi:colicin import membrane protein